MKIFGSDGFRCKFGDDFLTYRSLTSFAHALGDYYLLNELKNSIVIARDTRESGRIIEQIIVSVLNFKGIDVSLAGVLPTPGISKLLEIQEFALGCMITASHNPHYDNGIKLLGMDGFKLDKKIEFEIEKIMLSSKLDCIAFNKKIGKNTIVNSPFEKYLNTILQDFKVSSIKEKILIDCSNGAYSYKLPEHLRFLDNIEYKSNVPNGNNINLKCGALEPNLLLESVIKGGFDYGIAFDGDGDRAIFVSRIYGIIETEKLACLFFKMLSSNNTIKVISSSEISNLAFLHNINQLGCELKETLVGDRFVIESVNQHQAIFGFEPSGHFYFPDICKSMDGLVAALKFIELVSKFGQSLPKELVKLKHYYRITKNIDLQHKADIDLNNLISKVSSLINDSNEKIIIRKSMWDPVLRVYYDYIYDNNFEVIEMCIQKLIAEEKN